MVKQPYKLLPTGQIKPGVMVTQKEKIIKSLKKGVKEMKQMEAGELQAQDFGEMMHELKADREKHGGAGRGKAGSPQGTPPAYG